MPNKKIVTVVSDLHVGSSLGLCPTSGMILGEGGIYMPSRFQLEIGRAFELFFSAHVKQINRGAKKRILVFNGDLIEGNHHNTVALASNNIEVQEAAAIALLKPVVKEFDQVFVVRGTEAHVGPGAQSDERIAKALGAIPLEEGQNSWWQLWLDVDGMIFNIAHHLGTTSSAAYESSAVMRELVAALVEAGQWQQQMPDVMVRSHRHRFIELAIPKVDGKIHAVVTPSFQLRTPFVERLDRFRQPHIGGVCFVVESGKCQIQEKLFPMKIGTPVVV